MSKTKAKPTTRTPIELALDALYEEQTRLEVQQSEIEDKLMQIEDAISALEDVDSL